jgi:hypothetical protein
MITQSSNPRRVVIEVDWQKPFATRNVNELIHAWQE